MRLFTFNALICLLVYVPLTLILGLAVDAFKVAGIDDSGGYEFFLWFVVTIQMIVPTLMLFAVIHLAIRKSVRASNTTLRRAASIGANGLLLPLLQGFLWAGANLSFTWVVVAVLPALVLGGLTSFQARVRII